jgi:flagellin
LRINTNVSSLQAQSALEKVRHETGRSQTKLSSGGRINSASDDAAGLAISNKMKASVRSSNQAFRNANDGISLVQVAEGSLNEVAAIFIRMRELATQSATGTLSDENRQLIDLEFQQIRNESERIMNSTTFNGRDLLEGSSKQLSMQILDLSVRDIDIQVGINADAATNKIGFSPTKILISQDDFNFSSLNIRTQGAAQSSFAEIDRGQNKIAESRSYLGAMQNRLQSAANNLQIFSENTSEAQSRISDADYAFESAKIAANKVREHAAVSVLAQANDLGLNVLKLVG